ncbi:hypothetical protein H1C71_010152, partial [Ictidomys tridecemlineatus]
ECNLKQGLLLPPHVCPSVYNPYFGNITLSPKAIKMAVQRQFKLVVGGSRRAGGLRAWEGPGKKFNPCCVCMCACTCAYVHVCGFVGNLKSLKEEEGRGEV